MVFAILCNRWLTKLRIQNKDEVTGLNSLILNLLFVLQAKFIDDEIQNKHITSIVVQSVHSVQLCSHTDCNYPP